MEWDLLVHKQRELVFGGYNTGFTNETEEYNGSSWTAGGSLSQARNAIGGGLGGAGIQTAGLAVGGYNPTSPPGYFTDFVEEYNGSTWTSGVQVHQLLLHIEVVAGIQTAALYFGGSPYTNATLEYDGSTWTAGGSLNHSKIYISRSRNSNSSFSFWWLYSDNCYKCNRRI
jgi:hypothetical protein